MILKRFLWLFFIFLSIAQAQAQTSQPAIVSEIQQIVGIKGNFDAQQQVLVFNLPQSQFGVRAAGVRITPPMGLQSWIDIKILNDNSALLLADLVLTQEQVDAVISTALENNFEVMALVNQFSWESPRLMFLNVAAQGEPLALAKGTKAILDTIIATQNTRVKETYIDPDDTKLDSSKIDALGYKSEFNNGTYVVRIPQKSLYKNIEVSSDMGVMTKIIFAGTQDKVVVTGAFAVEISQLQNLLKSLRKANISIVGINQPLLHTQEPLIFVRFWGVGSFDNLLQGIKQAMTYLPKAVNDNQPK